MSPATGTSTAHSPGSAQHCHISALALPARFVLVWAGGEGRLPGARLSGWQSARTGSMGAPCRGRHRMQEQSRAARSVGLAGREVGNWKGLELTPLWGTTGAGQLGSPPCSARGVSGDMEKDCPHLSAFAMPRTSVCCAAAQRHREILPGESPGQGDGGCMPQMK